MKNEKYELREKNEWKNMEYVKKALKMCIFLGVYFYTREKFVNISSEYLKICLKIIKLKTQRENTF